MYYHVSIHIYGKKKRPCICGKYEKCKNFLRWLEEKPGGSGHEIWEIAPLNRFYVKNVIIQRLFFWVPSGKRYKNKGARGLIFQKENAIIITGDILEL